MADANPKQPKTTQAEIDLKAYAEELFEQARKSRKWNWERSAYLAYQFFRGNQWVEWDDTRAVLTFPDKVPNWRVRLVDNRIFSIARNIASRITDQKWGYEVDPGTENPEDLDRAKLVRSFIQYLHEKLRFVEKIEELALSFVLYGLAYLEITWDAKEKMVRFDVVDAFSVYVDPRATSLEDARYVIKEKSRTYDELKGNPNYDLTDLRPGERYLVREYQIRETTDAGKQQIRLLVTANHDQETSSELKRRIELQSVGPIDPDPKKPADKNRIASTKSDTVIIRNEKSPYEHGEFSLVDFHNIHIPSEFYSLGDVEMLIPLQKEYNKTKSQLIEIKNLMSKPKWLLPKNSGVPEDSITSEPGEIVPYNIGFKPEVVTPPSIPAYVIEQLQELKGDMEDVVGVHNFSVGAGRSLRSGIAIQLLLEADQTTLHPKHRHFESALTRAGKLEMAVLQQFMTGETLVRETGEGVDPKVWTFNADQLKGQWDVRVHAEAQIDYSKTAARAQLLDLFKAGAIGRRILLKHYEFPNVEEAVQDAEAEDIREALLNPQAAALPQPGAPGGSTATTEDQMELAEIENESMMEGEQVNPETVDDHELHLTVHATFIEETKDLSPESLKLFRTHIEEHKELFLAAQKIASEPQGQPAGPMQPAPVAPPTAVTPTPGPLPPQKRGKTPPPSQSLTTLPKAA